MKHFIALFFVCLGFCSNAQEESLNLTNALIVGQLDKEDDRFSIEINLAEFFGERGIKALPSLNILKQGADLSKLANDSLQNALKAKGIDTYMLVSVRGYDRKFKPTTGRENFEEALNYGTLFSLYRSESVSVTFEIHIYRNNQLVKSQIIKCGNISSRESVLKRLRKKLDRKMKKW